MRFVPAGQDYLSDLDQCLFIPEPVSECLQLYKNVVQESIVCSLLRTLFRSQQTDPWLGDKLQVYFLAFGMFVNIRQTSNFHLKKNCSTQSFSSSFIFHIHHFL